MTSAAESFPLSFRLGTPADYPSVLDIQYRAYRQKEMPLYGPSIPPLAETVETLAAEIAGGKHLLVGENNGRIVASLRMKTLDDGAMYWGRLSVDPDLQGRGIGQRMALAVEQFCPATASLVLDCGEKSDENMHIYTKIGYNVTGESFQVPDGPKVLVMRKNRSLDNGRSTS